jgi:hypothetical protein
MADVTRYTFNYKEIAEALIQKQGIHEGLWGIYLEFAISAANIPAGPSKQELVPTAIVPVIRMGIQRFDKPSSLTVDAAEVNPRRPSGFRRRGQVRHTRTEQEEEA